MLSVSIVVFGWADVHAQPPEAIVRERFLVGPNDYFPGNPLADQNPIVSPGFTGDGSEQWEASSARFIIQRETLMWDDLGLGSGGRAEYIPDFPSEYRVAARLMDSYEPASEYFMSFLVHPGDVFLPGVEEAGYALVGLTDSFSQASFNNLPGAPPVAGAFVGFTADLGDPFELEDDKVNLIVRTRSLSGNLEDFVLLPSIEAETHLVVLKIDVGELDSVDQLTYWVNPSDASSEEALSATSWVTDSFPTLAVPDTRAINQLTAVTDVWERGFAFDEIGFGNDPIPILAPILQCDLNGDGSVDASDMSIVFANWSGAGLGDLNGDGVVDAADAGICFAEWTGDSDAQVQVVPEPSDWMLFAIACAPLAWHRRGGRASRVTQASRLRNDGFAPVHKFSPRFAARTNRHLA